MLLPILLVFAMQSDILRPDLPPTGGGGGTSVMSPSVANHYKDGLPVFGTLHFPDNTKQKVADVELYNWTGMLIEKLTTANSRFEFDKVPLGIYYIDVVSPGIEVSRKQLVLTQNDFVQVEITIDLHRKAGTPQDSESVLSAAKSAEPISRDAVKEYDKAIEEEHKGGPAKAIPHLEKAIKLSPNYFDAILQFGLDNKQTGNADAAIPLLARSVALNPASAVARLALGQLYFEKQQFQQAVDQLQEEIKVGSANAEAFYTLGTSHYKLDQLAEAEQDLRQSLNISEETMGKAHLQLYNVYMRGNRRADALLELNVYLEKYPNASDRQVIQSLVDNLRKEHAP